MEESRYLLRQMTEYFRDMAPEPGYNWCCGVCGGLVMLGQETLEFRMNSSKVKADQVRGTGARILDTACKNCHTQFSNLHAHCNRG